ncbi:protein phosphatase 2C domain-containing protein [Streptomyces albidoflavus]|uniref:protein phosphatase 2C domain-containing protein n=1 Tax=Streptomyces albidoflavus TaxID=1886 RepID=UPI00101E82F9|nr:protein phosphatase 2C domain-containing protein [Streptomyces albidoflavus]RZD69304.1 serine/threonine protein phosphatase [Streptomyces albidoflavus]RZE95126.1 serine/threonine protein phosphatase [Streptomyces albidoflavus]RZE96791.1 serine/threonine protein phosphatase [Streptomyces albidoflavus]
MPEPTAYEPEEADGLDATFRQNEAILRESGPAVPAGEAAAPSVPAQGSPWRPVHPGEVPPAPAYAPAPAYTPPRQDPAGPLPEEAGPPRPPAPEPGPPAASAPTPEPEAGPDLPELGDPWHGGPKPPLYRPVPQAAPAVPSAGIEGALVPDIVVDGAEHGALTVRAASVRGDSHRYQAEPRQDSVCVARIGSGESELLVLGVADGVGSAPLSHVGSQKACAFAAGALDRVAGPLAAAVAESDLPGFTALARQATAEVATLLRHEAERYGRRPSEFATTLRLLVVPLDPEVRVRGLLTLGDGGTALLREGRWDTALGATEEGDGAVIDTRTPALPTTREPVATLISTRPGDVLVVCTDGLSTPLAGDQDTARFLARAWSPERVPGPADFLWQLQYRVKSYDDDRSAVVLWEGPAR